MSVSPRLSALFTYGLLAAPLAFAGLPVYVHAPDFYAREWGVSLALIGGILVVMRLIDALQDPLIGSLSDRWHAHRRTMVLTGGLLTGVGFWMLFHPVGSPAFWLAVSILICTTGFSLVSINLQAMGGLWPVPANDRLKVSGVREGLGLIGLLSGTILPTLLLRSLDARTAFDIVAWVFLPLLIAGLIAFTLWSARTPLPVPTHEAPPNGLRLLRNPWLQRFSLIYGLSSLASAIPAVLIVFYVRDYLRAEAWMGLFLIIYFLSGAAMMPVWQRLGKTRSTAQLWGLSMGLAAVTFVWAFFLPPGSVVAFALICALSGMAFGADMALPPTLLSERIDSEGHATAASRYYALIAFLSKAALAVATGLTLPALAVAGYVPGQIAQTQALPYAYALLPCLIKLIAAAIFWRERHHFSLANR